MPSGSPSFVSLSSGYRFCRRVLPVHPPVGCCRLLACVGIAVFTKMGAGVVLPDVLGGHTAAGGTLARVFPVTADEIPVAG